MLLKQDPQLILKAHAPMVLLLMTDILDNTGPLGFGNRKGCVFILPPKRPCTHLMPQPSRGLGFYLSNKVRHRDGRVKPHRQMQVILHSTAIDQDILARPCDTSNVPNNPRPQVIR